MATGGKEQVSYSLVKERTVTLNDKRPIYDSIIICQDKIIVVGINDKKVKSYRLHDGKFLDKLDSDSRPSDICLMDATTICVLHHDGLIEMASIKSEDMSPVFTRMKSFRLDGVFDYYRSVVKVNDNIVVVGVKHDRTYWCIVSLDDGHVDTIHGICKMSFKSSVTTKDNIIYISCSTYDDDTGVYGFDILNPSQCKYKYKHQRLDRPTSIVINEDGNIFVGNGVLDNPCIHQLTASCQLVAIFTEGIPWALHAMFWDKGRLYITCSGRHDITVFRHIYQEGSQKHSEFLMSHDKKEPIIVKTSKEIEQGNVEKGQSSEEMEPHPSTQMRMDYGDHKDDQNPEESTRFIEWIKESSFTEIEFLLKYRMVPSKSTILHAIKEHGLSHKGIQCLLKGMSNLLRKQIPKAIQVWSGYRTEDLHTPVFVVMFGKKTGIPEMKFSKPYDEYEIVFRKMHTPNQEEERVSEQSEVHAKTINKEDMKPVVDCIAENTECLMNEHSNLSIIAASTVKAKGFNGCLSKLELVQSKCIVLYVPVKGIIPVGENEFVKCINGIETDVREGEFVSHVQRNPDEFHQNLRMGCCIANQDDTRGTLGGFVDLPLGKTGCITAAHVVLNKQQRKMAMNKKKMAMAMDETYFTEDIEIFQPSREYATFGKVIRIAFNEGNQYASTVDAALIEITVHTRTPNTGLFPFHDYPVNDFTKENPMMYNSGKTRDHSDISIGSTIVKYGYATNITCGTLVFGGTTVRMVYPGAKSVNTPNDYDDSYPRYFQQMVVKSSDTKKNFSAEGDSGALVFMYDKTNGVLEAIGLLIGANTNENVAQKTFVTPIKDVFQQLGLTKSNFKVFQMPNEGEENLMNDSS